MPLRNNETIKVSSLSYGTPGQFDSLRCKITNRPAGLSGLGVGEAKYNSDPKSRPFCYCSNTETNYSLASSNLFEMRGFRFENGSYTFTKHGLYVSYLSSLEDIEKEGAIYFYKILPVKVKMFKRYEFRLYKDFPQYYEFQGFEDVQIEGRTYEKCLKLKISGSNQYENDSEFVWLFKGAGMIKKQMSNGVIKEYAILEKNNR